MEVPIADITVEWLEANRPDVLAGIRAQAVEGCMTKAESERLLAGIRAAAIAESAPGALTPEMKAANDYAFRHSMPHRLT